MSSASMYAMSDRNKQNNTDTTLLQTFRAWTKGAKSSCNIRDILNNGSQHSFIKEHVSRKMTLKVLGEIDLTVNVFGNKGAHQSTP